MRFEGAEGAVHLRCSRGLVDRAPGIFTFSFCVNYDCLPLVFGNKTLDVTAEKVLIPESRSNATSQNQTATLVTFMVPPCVTSSSTAAFEYIENGQLAALPRTPGNKGVFQLPASGIDALSFHTVVEPSCQDRHVIILITSSYLQRDLPPVPTTSCPCWVTPQEAVDPNSLGCDGIKIPVTLETIPDWRLNDGISFRQCIDPANFDFL